MKVNGTGNGGRIDAPASGGAATRSNGIEGGPSAGPAASGEVRLSGLGDLGKRLAAAPEFDQAKVERIKTAIAAGEVRMDAGAVADRLIESVRELLAGKAS